MVKLTAPVKKAEIYREMLESIYTNPTERVDLLKRWGNDRWSPLSGGAQGIEQMALSRDMSDDRLNVIREKLVDNIKWRVGMRVLLDREGFRGELSEADFSTLRTNLGDMTNILTGGSATDEKIEGTFLLKDLVRRVADVETPIPTTGKADDDVKTAEFVQRVRALAEAVRTAPEGKVPGLALKTTIIPRKWHDTGKMHFEVLDGQDRIAAHMLAAQNGLIPLAPHEVYVGMISYPFHVSLE